MEGASGVTQVIATPQARKYSDKIQIVTASPIGEPPVTDPPPALPAPPPPAGAPLLPAQPLAEAEAAVATAKKPARSTGGAKDCAKD
jgi:hypothetical protein